MELKVVQTQKHRKDFLKVPVKINAKDPHFIRALDKDVEAVFDPAKNKLLRHGEIERWVLYDHGLPVGRIAAFVNQKTVNKNNSQPTGGCGFFDSPNDPEVAAMLFDQAKSWLQERGMEAMDGPINLGERDRFWGCLVDGFTDPNYCCNYNPQYYAELFEGYGFQMYFRQFTFGWPMDTVLPDRYRERAERIGRNPDYRMEHIRIADYERYAEDFMTVYNAAWANHSGVAAMRKAQAMALFKQLKPVADPDIIWYAYYKDEPVGFFIMLPELNQIFRRFNGKLHLWNKLRFLWHKKRHTCRKMFGVVFGIAPDHQGKGLEGAIITAAAQHNQPKKRYDMMEMNWIGDFNPVMLKMCEDVGASIVKTHHTYRYLFDRSKPFERAPIIGSEAKPDAGGN